MAAVTLAASVGASMTAATGRPEQSHLVYGANNAQWYLFYLTSTNVLSLKYSADFATWNASASSLTFAHAHNSQGLNFGFNYTNLASLDIVHGSFGYPLAASGAAGESTYHARFTLGATTWTLTHAEAEADSGTGTMTNPIGGNATLLALNGSSGYVFDASGLLPTPAHGAGNSTAIIGSTVDSGSAWTNNWPAAATEIEMGYTPNTNHFAFAQLAGASVLLVANGNTDTPNTFNQIRYYVWTTSWAVGGFALTTEVTQTDTDNFCILGRTTTDVHCVSLLNNASTFEHTRFNGSTWAANSGGAPPALTVAASSGIFLAGDGTDIWLFAIDSSYNVKVVKWTGAAGTWGASWTTAVAAGSYARSFISGYQKLAGTNIGLIWTENNTGTTNYDIVGALYPTVAAPTVTYTSLERGTRGLNRGIFVGD